MINILQKDGKPQKVMAERPGCLQSAVWKNIHATLTGREKCSRKRCTSNRDNIEKIVEKKLIQELQRASREVESGWSQSIKSHYTSSGNGLQLLQPCTHEPETMSEAFYLGRGENIGTIAQWSKMLFLKVDFAFHLDPESGRVEAQNPSVSSGKFPQPASLPDPNPTEQDEDEGR